MRKLLSLLAATGLVAGSLFATAGTASAAEGDVTITVGEIAVEDLVISAAGCRQIPVSVPYQTEGGQVELYVVAGSLAVSTLAPELLLVDVAAAGRLGPGFEVPIEGAVNQLRWCPGWTADGITGLGRFTLSGMDLAWAGVAADGSDVEGDVHAARTASFMVRQAAKATSVKISKKRTKRTLSAKLAFFDVGRNAWKALPKGTRVELQRSVPGSGAWTKLKTVKVGAKGSVKTTYKTRTTYEYRFFYPGDDTRAPVTSKILRK